MWKKLICVEGNREFQKRMAEGYEMVLIAGGSPTYCVLEDCSDNVLLGVKDWARRAIDDRKSVTNIHYGIRSFHLGGCCFMDVANGCENVFRNMFEMEDFSDFERRIRKQNEMFVVLIGEDAFYTDFMPENRLFNMKRRGGEVYRIDASDWPNSLDRNESFMYCLTSLFPDLRRNYSEFEINEEEDEGSEEKARERVEG